MAPKDSGDAFLSPSASSTLLPFGLGQRRASVTSISSRAHLDREVLDHALDEIHTSASQSDHLTTFNDFAAPPPGPPPSDDRSIASQFVSSGLEGIYSKFKSSVGASKDRASSSSSSRPATRTSRLAEVNTSVESVPSSKPEEQVQDIRSPLHSRPASIKTNLSSTKEAKSPSKAPASLSHANLPAHEQSSSMKSADGFAPSSPQSPVPQRVEHVPIEMVGGLEGSSTDKGMTKGIKSEISDSNVTHFGPATSGSNEAVGKGILTDDAAANLDKSQSQPFLDDHSNVSDHMAPSVNGDDSASERTRFADPVALQKLTGTNSRGSEPRPRQRSPSLLSSARRPLPSPRTHRSESRYQHQPQTSSLMHEMRRKVLSRDFWMKDENAKACYNCGDSFTTFRRKHHCRTCGQIYDAKCTVLISGKLFGQSGKLRICKTCENIIVGEDSSGASEDDELPAISQHQVRFSALPTDSRESLSIQYSQANERPSSQHSFSRPRPKSQESRRKTISMAGDDIYPSLTRPTSSRSLKSLSGRPRSSSQRYPRSRHQHMRSLGFLSYGDFTGLHDTPTGDEKHDSPLPAFHTNAILDPDLAPFVSDEDTSDEELGSISSRIHDNSGEYSAGSVGGFMTAFKRARARPLSKGNLDTLNVGRDGGQGIASARGQRRRQMGSRTLSAGSLLSRPAFSPRLTRSENLFTDSLPRELTDSLRRAGSPPRPATGRSLTEFSKDLETVESLADLDKTFLDHVKSLLTQFLVDASIRHVTHWQKALVPILLRCAEEVDPNIHRGDDIDIRNYVKLKKAPGGKPGDSTYVSGVVFTKNLALKSMRRPIRNARILLVSFPLIYARHQQHFMSLDPVIAQEREYLKNLVMRIVALGPNVVLVQHEVSGLAIQFLHEANIVVAYNVKQSVLQAISRCTQTRILSSVDKLTMDPRHLGTCQTFEVRTMSHGHQRKSYMFLSGCQKDLGCTIVLRGADLRTLADLKWVTEFMCYVVYNLKLETCLVRDQFMSVSSHGQARNVLCRTTTQTHEADDSSPRRNGSRMAQSDLQAINQASTGTREEEEHSQSAEVERGRPSRRPPDVTNPKLPPDDDSLNCAATVNELQSRLLSISPTVKLPEPYLLLQGRDQETQMLRLKNTLRELDSGQPASEQESKPKKFEMVSPDMVLHSPPNPSLALQRALRAIWHTEYEKASESHASLQRRWESYISGVREPFSPLSHQQIVVLFSIISTPDLEACEGPDLLGLAFYQEHETDSSLEPDFPLGEYIERLCHHAEYSCVASRCDKSMMAHHRQYVHGEGQITVGVEKQPPKLRGLRNTILMWSKCRKCDEETPVTPMSLDSWKYSFAKYLEMSFWGHKLSPKTGFCQHDIHKDHIRSFGFRDLAVRVQYDAINIVDIIVPRGIISWRVGKDISLKNREFAKIEESLYRFMTSVLARIESIKVDSVESEKKDLCRAEIENFRQRAKAERELLLRKLQDKYSSSEFFEIIPLNRAVRAMQEKVAGWDSTFAEFESNYFPSENDIRKLAAQQLKKVYLDRDQPPDVSENITSPEMEGSLEKSFVSLDLAALDDQGAVNANPTPNASDPSARHEEDAVTATKPLSAKDDQVIKRLDLAVSPGTPTDRGSRTPLEQSPTKSFAVPRSNIDTSPLKKEKDDPAGPGQMSQPTESISPSFPEAHAEPISTRRKSPNSSPPLLRSQTQPVVCRSADSVVEDEKESSRGAASRGNQQSMIPVPVKASAPSRQTGHGHKSQGNADGAGGGPSMIPRSKKLDTKVSALARHFEHMSREFEKQRLRERRQRAARVRQAQVYPTSSFQPVVEVFRNADEAVHERDLAIEGLETGESKEKSIALSGSKSEKHRDQSVDGSRDQAEARKTGSFEDPYDTSTEALRSESSTVSPSFPPSESADIQSEKDQSFEDQEFDEKLESGLLSPTDPHAEFLDIPKHDKSSIIKMLTSFWSERSSAGWAPLEYPLVATDHIFADSDVIVREDEPSSLIAFALASEDYTSKLQRFRERSTNPSNRNKEATEKRTGEQGVEQTLLGKTATHMKYQFQAGSSRMQCKIFYAESFDAIRQKCGVAERFVESLSRCLKWDSRGGKTKSLFLKTLDERFVVKSLSAVETQAFLRFAPDYFDYMSKYLFHDLPSALAKMLGFYQVVIKNPVTGVEFNSFLQVMENVFYEGPSNRLFDLKGSMRNRKIQSTGEKNEVLLDENLLDYISQSPMYVRNNSNSFLASSISNDTLFCSKQNVMDYSLIVGLYDDRQELMVGIIDYIRTYTWDKKLESWIKDRGKHKPTIRSPKEYRNRFRASISKYFPLAPSCWQVFGGQRVWERWPMIQNQDKRIPQPEGNVESDTPGTGTQ
ncbi:MAG: 1-phosphatidylinositol-3-phosphate 5-kinase [Alyxoria varia]|nr:MAG: 1-phosphatidylinositol-3-phosphate 5-kinase [Alyxoria varia]